MSINMLIEDRCIELYEKYYRRYRDRKSRTTFKDHIRKTDRLRELITHELTRAEEHSLRKLRFYPPADCHKSSNIFYAKNPELFYGKRILEIGSGRHIDRLLVELSQAYHGVDTQYKMIPFQIAMEYINQGDPFRFIGKCFTWPIRAIQRRMDKGLDDDYAYDFRSLRDSLDYKDEKSSSTGFVEYADKSGKILLVACDYRDLSMQYDVIINGGAPIKKEDIPKVKSLLTK